MKKIFQILTVVLCICLLFACTHPIYDECDCDCDETLTIYEQIKESIINYDATNTNNEIFDIKLLLTFDDISVFIVCLDNIFGKPDFRHMQIGGYIIYQANNWLQGILVLNNAQLMSLEAAFNTKIITLDMLNEILPKTDLIYAAPVKLPHFIIFDFYLLETIRTDNVFALFNLWNVIDDAETFEKFNQQFNLGIDNIDSLINFAVESLVLVRVFHSSSVHVDGASKFVVNDGLLTMLLDGYFPRYGHADLISTFLLIAVDQRIAQLIDDVNTIVDLPFPELDEDTATQISLDFRRFLQRDEEFEISAFYGRFNDAYVVMFNHPAWQMIGQETIEDIVINYSDSRRIYVWQNGTFLRLQEALDAKILTIYDIQIIANMQNNSLGW